MTEHLTNRVKLLRCLVILNFRPMTIITHLALRPRKKNTGTLRPNRGSAKRSEFGKPLPPSLGIRGLNGQGFQSQENISITYLAQKRILCHVLLSRIDRNFRLLFKLPDCICGVNLKSLISNRLTRLSCGASGIECRDGQDTGSTIIVEKLTVKLDAQQLSAFKLI